MMMNKLSFVRALFLRTSAYISCLHVSLSTLLIPLEALATSPDQRRQQPLSCYSIIEDGYLHYNLPVNDSSYLAMALNRHNLFLRTNVES
ncbi:hypothetical protein [Sphingobacterium sp. DR205]|uniref:hypothetical protein n=1 Tax=Sphingobacterium sp. DR205 TaxID=2713573 RepID=UPI0013E45E13|nr:hypothetical protein [Sphingobacterium sp. DR205]QIH35060.1 hypothetical protein G6053_20120 [Sphingobacterium sp. DR205]